MNDEAIDLLFEVREAVENCEPLSVMLLARIINHTNDYAQRSKLRSNGNAQRDRLVAARLNMRSES